MKSTLIFLVAFCVALTAFVWTENGIAPSFQSCISQSASEPGDKSSKNFIVPSVIKSQAICSFRLIDRHNGFFAALAAVIVAAFTFTLWIATSKQARLTKEVIDLTRAEQISNYRPRLRVRNIVVTPANRTLVERIGIFQPNHPVKGQLYVVNFGGSPANITESHCIVFWNDSGLPMRRPYEGGNGNNQIPTTRLEAGQSTSGIFLSDELMSDRTNTIGTKIVHGLRLYVMGWIEYADDRGIKRRTSFCREFQRKDAFGEGRFYAVDDPDYEHEE
jgi:hypothetical protein